MAHENATPRPWHYSHGSRRILGALDDDRCHPQIAEGISKRISESDPRAVQFERDAALIVEAVNAYGTLRAENERLRSAVAGVIEWDKRRGYIVPYAVRDPLHAALSEAQP